MKLINTFAISALSLLSFSAVFANTAGSKDNPVFKQCTVVLPDGAVAGICKEVGEKYFQILNCKGQLLAFVEPGALPTAYGATCGPNYIGFPGDK